MRRGEREGVEAQARSDKDTALLKRGAHTAGRSAEQRSD